MPPRDRPIPKTNDAPAVPQHAAILAVLLLPFLVLKSYGLNYAVSDENIYFYDAWLMTQGSFPYRDFFFAHPLLHLLPGWLLFSTTALLSLRTGAGAVENAGRRIGRSPLAARNRRS